MRKQFVFLLLASVCVTCLSVSLVHAEIVIKVRALNPLESEETAAIRYPLPEEVTPEDITEKSIIYSKTKEPEEVEEGQEPADPRKKTFNVEYDEDEGVYYIIDEVELMPREVVTLEARVKDIWMVSAEQIEGIRKEIEALMQHAQEAIYSNPGGSNEVDETVMALKGEIVKELEDIEVRQKANTVLKVGVQGHMESYYENMESLRQVESDLGMMRYLLEPEDEEEETDTDPGGLYGCTIFLTIS